MLPVFTTAAMATSAGTIHGMSASPHSPARPRSANRWVNIEDGFMSEQVRTIAISTRDQEFEAILDQVRRARGLEPSTYKRGTLTRRVLGRMQTTGVEHVIHYVLSLEEHPKEHTDLFDTVLINVT